MAEDERPDEEDISIDFSALKKLFKRKKKEDSTLQKDTIKDASEGRPTRSSGAHSEVQSEDEIELDFSWLKRRFNKSEKAPTETSTPDSSQKEDSDLSFDFSKIKKIFRGKEEQKDDEALFHFEDVKKLFQWKKSPPSQHSAKKQEKSVITDSEIFDFKKALGWWKGNKKWAVPLLCILIVISASFFLRIQPVYLHAADGWAEQAIEAQVKQWIYGQVSQQFPNLPETQKLQQVELQFQAISQEHGNELKQQREVQARLFREKLQDENGQTYLRLIDDYFWLLAAERILRNGYPGDELRLGTGPYRATLRPWDNHMYAPAGAYSDVSLHPYIAAYTTRLLRLLNPGISVKSVLFYLPLIVSLLTIVPAFFIVHRVTGPLGGFFSALLLAIHPVILDRTVAGAADTDPYNLLFPLLIVWAFLEAGYATNIWWRICLGAVAGVLVGLYAFTWIGWWYIFDMLLIGGIAFLAYSAIMNSSKSRFAWGFAYSFAVFILLATLTGLWLISSEKFVNFATQPAAFASLKTIKAADLWPNVYSTITEQRSITTQQAITEAGAGMRLLFFAAVLGIFSLWLSPHSLKAKKYWLLACLFWLLLLISFPPSSISLFLLLFAVPFIVISLVERSANPNLLMGMILLIWFAVSMYATIQGIRFILLLAPAVSLGAGILAGRIYYWFSDRFAQSLHITSEVSRLCIAGVLLLLLAIPATNAVSAARSVFPLFDDAWFAALTKIKEQSQPNAIITSWWDFGHLYKAIADRAVTFDGASQSSPQAHWVGKMFITKDENLSIGILRMLDCSGYNSGVGGFDELNHVVNDTPKAARLVEKVIAQSDRTAAQKILLSNGFSQQEADAVLDKTHCAPPEAFIVTSNDLVSKANVWWHFGLWDFEKAQIYQSFRTSPDLLNRKNAISYLKERYNYTDRKADQTYNELQSLSEGDANSWIAPPPAYDANAVRPCAGDARELQCVFSGLTAKVSLDRKDAAFASPRGNEYPRNLLIMSETEEEMVVFESGNPNVGFTVFPTKTGYMMILSSPEHVGSVFQRLFFMEGVGLRHFKKFTEERTLNDNRILIWKVDWEGGEKNTINLTVSAAQDSTGKNETVAVSPAPSGPNESARNQSSQALDDSIMSVNDTITSNKTMSNQSTEGLP